MPPSGLPSTHTLAAYNHPQGQGCHVFCFLSLFAHGSSPRFANHAKKCGQTYNLGHASFATRTLPMLGGPTGSRGLQGFKLPRSPQLHVAPCRKRDLQNAFVPQAAFCKPPGYTRNGPRTRTL
jgi:hypothetical protein